jgi:type II restriction enzyme
VQVIPALLACREKDFKILTQSSGDKLTYESYSFAKKIRLTEGEITDVCRFAEKSGLLNLFTNRRLKSVPDYFLGVEVGLDSNGRKNRGGDQMEALVELLIKPICSRHGYKFLRQASPATIKATLGETVVVGKKSKTFDFAVKTPSGLFLFETNYYNGSGSKLNETAGHYTDLHAGLADQGFGFIWITDGQGWLKTTKPLRDTFSRVDHVLNLRMIFSGLLDHILATPAQEK